MYHKFRCPLVHDLAVDEADEEEKLVIGKWGKIPKGNRDIELFDTMDEWSNQWPVLYPHKSEEGPPCMTLCCAALYRALKQTAINLIKERRET